mgnify:FL=1
MWLSEIVMLVLKPQLPGNYVFFYLKCFIKCF